MSVITTEFWPKVFLAAALTAAAAKLFRCPVDFVLLFFVSSIGWAALWLLLLAVAAWLEKRKR